MNREEALKIFGLTEGATQEEINKAYKTLAMKHHPDKHSNKEQSIKKEQEELFKIVGAAHDVLSNKDPQVPVVVQYDDKLSFKKLHQAELDIIKANLSKITELNLFLDEKPTDDEMSQLIDLLKNTTKISSFIIYRADIKSSDLIDSLKNNSNLAHINFSHANISDEIAMDITNVISNNFPKLRSLDFSDNPLHLDAIERLYTVLHNKLSWKTLKDFKRDERLELEPKVRALFNNSPYAASFSNCSSLNII